MSHVARVIYKRVFGCGDEDEDGVVLKRGEGVVITSNPRLTSNRFAVRAITD